MTEHSASQCQNVAVQEDSACSLWDEPLPTSHTASDNEMVLMLLPADEAHIATLLTITCGKVQMQTSWEPTTFDPFGQTILSIRLLLAIEGKQRSELTIEALIDEIADNPQFRQLTLPQPKEWQVKGVTSIYHAYSLIPVKVNVDGVEMRFEATIITDAFLLEFAFFRKNYDAITLTNKIQLEMREWTSARRSWYLSPFQTLHPCLCEGLLALAQGYLSSPSQPITDWLCTLVTCCDPTVWICMPPTEKPSKLSELLRTWHYDWMAMKLKPTLSYWMTQWVLKTSCWAATSLRTCQNLVDLTAMKVIVRAPSRPVWYHAHAQVSSEPLTSNQWQ